MNTRSSARTAVAIPGTRWHAPAIDWSALAERHAALVLLGVAIASRFVLFGNPTVHVDDQFYLLVGDRLLHGTLPYVDIWDRKPIGLFLIYAAIRALGGSGIVQYQLIATGFAWATALVVRRLARRLGPPRAATAAGAIYLLALTTAGGAAGQAPVFYNLLTALAALAVVRAIEAPRDWRMPAAAMALMGLAIQVKYTTLFEGLFFGVALLELKRRAGLGAAALARAAALWLMLGAAPTLLALAVYAALGHADVFAFANFGSIFLRHNDAPELVASRLGAIVLKLAALEIVAIASWRRAVRRDGGAVAFLFGWVLAAYAGVLVFGSYFPHYALPLLVPLAVVAAPTLGDARARIWVGMDSWRASLHVVPLLMLLEGGLGVAMMADDLSYHGRGREIPSLVAYIRAHDRGGCPFVYDGEPVLYHLAGACLPTRWPFPDHLNNSIEDGATGVDPAEETARIMAGRPPLVVTSAVPEDKQNQRSLAVMQRELAAHYRLGARWTIGSRVREVYLRDDAR